MRIVAHESGTGTPLILIHGVWMSSRFYERNVPELSQRFHVIAVDLPSHGASPKFPDGHTVGAYAREIDQFIRSRGFKKVALAGWSMGCFVIWDYIQQFGTSQLAANILVSQGPTDFRWPDWPHGPFDLTALQSMMRKCQEDQEGLLRGYLPNMFKTHPGEKEIEWMLAETLKVPASTASAILFDQSLVDYRNMLQQIDVPTLLCWGRDEKCVAVSDGAYIQNQLKGSKLVIFEESGHCPFFEEARKFNSEVSAFLRSNARN